MASSLRALLYRPLTGLAGPDYDATISFALPFESEDSQYGKYRIVEYPAWLWPTSIQE